MDSLATPPIERCPREILENIFLESLPPAHEPDRSLMPLKLSHVCSKWRMIAFHLPQLWRFLYIVKNPRKSSKYDPFWGECEPSGSAHNLAQLAKLWADNARDYSLSVHFEMHAICVGIGDLLARYADRMRSLTFQVHSSYTDVHIFEPFLVASTVEQLESLHLEWNYTYNIHPNTITTFSCAPKLRKLRLGFTSSDTGDVMEPSFSSYCFMIPWTQLTHVCMDTLSVETWDEFVRYSPRLEECLVTFGRFANSFSPLMLAQLTSNIPHPTSIPHLRKFGINLGRSGGLYSFENLEMPALDTLQISAKPWSRNERARKFRWRHSLVPSYQWLKNLSNLTVSVQDMSTSIADFAGILPYATSLKNLSIYYIENGSDVELILQSLIFNPAVCESPEEVTLPNLRHLTLEMANTYDLRPATQTLPSSIRDFVKCRWWTKDLDILGHPTARLEGCDIGMVFFRKKGAKRFFDDVESSIGTIMSEGLRIRVYESHCDWNPDQMTHNWW